MQKETFIDELESIGFDVLSNAERTRYSKEELMFMEENKKNNYLKDLENTPQTLLFNKEYNITIELFSEGDTITQANGIYKYSNSVAKQDDIKASMPNMDIIKSEENLVHGKIENIQKVKFSNIEEMKGILHAYSNPFVSEEKIKFDANELSFYSFMENGQQIPSLMNKKLNEMFTDNIMDSIKYPKGFQGRNKPTI